MSQLLVPEAVTSASHYDNTVLRTISLKSHEAVRE